MSHVTTLKGIVISDERAMQAAVRRLQERGVNCALVENQKPRVHGYDAAPTCEKVLKLNDGQYDVGFQKQADGTYEPIFDTYMEHVGGQIGASCPLPNTPGGRQQHQMGQFLQLYSEEATRQKALDLGYMVEDVTTNPETGEVTMTLTGME